MSHDMLMLRGDVAGGFNLAVGEPVFLQKALGDLSKYYLTPPDVRYPPFAGTPSLLEALCAYHGGAYDHFVVTIGAKQALVAAFHALSQTLKTQRVYTKAPYWPSYPTLVKSAGLQIQTVRSRPLARDIIVNTTPNNPDGSFSNSACDIWDAAYAHPVYGFDSTVATPEDESDVPHHKVAVYSAAKLLGLSGLRIGWLATNDLALAKLAGEYVEKATSGVSTHDQFALEGVIRAANEGTFHRSYQVARSMLDENRRTLDQELGMHIESVSADAGMFAWFKPRDSGLFQRALETSQVKLIPGNACGGHPDFYRMSLGHDVEHTMKALTTLREALEN